MKSNFHEAKIGHLKATLLVFLPNDTRLNIFDVSTGDRSEINQQHVKSLHKLEDINFKFIFAKGKTAFCGFIRFMHVRSPSLCTSCT